MNWKTVSSSVGVLPPLHVTFWISVSSPDPLDSTSRCQPELGTNESMPKPLGGVSSTVVVVRPSFSVGTASVKSWVVVETATGGLISACADAPAAATSARGTIAPLTSVRARTEFAGIAYSFRRGKRGGCHADVRSEGEGRAPAAQPQRPDAEAR